MSQDLGLSPNVPSSPNPVEDFAYLDSVGRTPSPVGKAVRTDAAVYPDYSRQSGHLDNGLLASSYVLAIGVGRARSMPEQFAAMGVRHIGLVDPGTYDNSNISQAGISCDEVGLAKVECVARSIKRINPSAEVTAVKAKLEDVTDIHSLFSRANIVIDGTDSMGSARKTAQLALQAGVDVLHLKTTADNRQYAIAGTLKGGNGCVRCICKSANDAVEDGHRSAPFYPSHRIVPETLNVKAVWVTLGLLHYRAGSSLAIADIGRRFVELPAWVGFNGITENGEIFPVRAWREPVPAGWQCPDCGWLAT